MKSCKLLRGFELQAPCVDGSSTAYNRPPKSMLVEIEDSHNFCLLVRSFIKIGLCGLTISAIWVSLQSYATLAEVSPWMGKLVGDNILYIQAPLCF